VSTVWQTTGKQQGTSNIIAKRKIGMKTYLSLLWTLLWIRWGLDLDRIEIEDRGIEIDISLANNKEHNIIAKKKDRHENNENLPFSSLDSFQS